MFNRISFFAIVIITITFFASCTKDPIAIGLELPTNQIETTVDERSTTVEIQVQEVSSSEVGNEFLVQFSGNYDFTGETLEAIQYLKFEDANNNVSTLTFQVNSFTGTSGDLQVAFDIGTNNLAGLSLAGAQEIIIDDFYFE